MHAPKFRLAKTDRDVGERRPKNPQREDLLTMRAKERVGLRPRESKTASCDKVREVTHPV
jgi:hypothetical protein